MISEHITSQTTDRPLGMQLWKSVCTGARGPYWQMEHPKISVTIICKTYFEFVYLSKTKSLNSIRLIRNIRSYYFISSLFIFATAAAMCFAVKPQNVHHWISLWSLFPIISCGHQHHWSYQKLFPLVFHEVSLCQFAISYHLTIN